ncbi:MAG: aldolase/citrate lyase family protein [Deltaproteobacteria bacterium]|nr:aldolase/citrate lyase family protein [Deltaproteobacteria bacterium]
MKSTEQKMFDTLKKLRDEYGVEAVKAEFEAEGSRTDELVKLNEIVFRADLNMYIKIGGCEAVRDIDQCLLLGAKGIMAPMIETPFAMQKFISAATKVYTEEERNDIDFIINAETKTMHANIDDIYSKGKGFLQTVVIGRVDLSASLGIPRSDINNDTMLEITKDILIKSKQYGYVCGLGGDISNIEAVPFIMKLEEYIDRIETRKIIFNLKNVKNKLNGAVKTAIEFEYYYMKNKQAFYDRMANEDKERILKFEKRLAEAAKKTEENK